MNVWRLLGYTVQYKPPLLYNFILKVNLWWGSTLRGLDYGTFITNVQELQKSSLCWVCDIWNSTHGRFYNGEETRDAYQFEEDEQNIWEWMLDSNNLIIWAEELKSPSKGLDYGELINDSENLLEDPIGVFCTSKELMPIVDGPY